jgi:hypothetical protein
MTTYNLTVYVATAGAKESNGSNSPLGHMWFSIQEGSNAPQSYGFIPNAADTPITRR